MNIEDHYYLYACHIKSVTIRLDTSNEQSLLQHTKNLLDSQAKYLTLPSSRYDFHA